MQYVKILNKSNMEMILFRSKTVSSLPITFFSVKKTSYCIDIKTIT